MNPNSRGTPQIAGVIVLVVGLLFAVLVGGWAGRSSVTQLGAVFGAAAAVGLLLVARQRVWLLIPLCWPLAGSITFTQLPFSIREMSILAAAASFVVFFALRRIPARHKLHLTDILIGLNLAYLLSVFVRNPVGTRFFGSELVGGRPYFVTFLGFVAYLILVRVRLKPDLAYRLPAVLTIIPLALSLLGLASTLSPAVQTILGKLYTGFLPSLGLATPTFDASTSRFTGLANGAMTLGLALCAYHPPLTLLIPLYLGRFSLFMTSIVGILLSGYRNIIAAMGVYFLLATYMKEGVASLLRIALIGAACYIALVGLQLSFGNVPYQAQRALSFLPGPWDPDAVADAKESTEWRVDMWKIVMRNDSFIKNRLLGDGFGFSAYDLKIMLNIYAGGQGFIGGTNQEMYMINGAFHSGPLSTIRFVGFVGLFLFMLLQLSLVLTGIKLIRLSRNTPYWPISLFIGLPLFYGPVAFVFVFGAFDSALPDTLYTAGLVMMLLRSVEEFHAKGGRTVEKAGRPVASSQRELLPA